MALSAGPLLKLPPLVARTSGALAEAGEAAADGFGGLGGVRPPKALPHEDRLVLYTGPALLIALRRGAPDGVNDKYALLYRHYMMREVASGGVGGDAARQ
eukprot:9500805-Pyramimonas_sp.AAC.1